MVEDGKDLFLEEVDRELRSINARLKKVLSKTQAILREHCRDTDDTEGGGGEEKDKQ